MGYCGAVTQSVSGDQKLKVRRCSGLNTHLLVVKLLRWDG